MYKYINGGDFKSKLKRYYEKNEIDIEKIHQKTDYNFDLEIIDKIIFKILQARFNQHKILIVGDYDCDGIISTVMIKAILDFHNINYEYQIPNRNTEGYGINKRIVDYAINNNFKIVITIDNGINALNEIERLKQHNIFTIIIDHHRYEIPAAANLIMHSFNLDDKGSFNNLCASALCYLIIRKVLDKDLLAYYKTLCAIALIADQMQIDNLTHLLIKEGLKELNIHKDNRITSFLDKRKLDEQNLAFYLIPALNAISRMNYDLNIAIDYLAGSYNEELFNKICAINNERKKLSDHFYSEVLKKLSHAKIELIHLKDCPLGIAGIIAGRISSEFKKPSIVLVGDKLLHGSARSVKDFDFHSFLKGFKEFVSIGGHSYALGLSIDSDNLMSLRNYLDTAIINDTNYEYIITLAPDDLNKENFDYLIKLSPFGQGYQKPKFILYNYPISSKIIINNKYPKWLLNGFLEVISFNTQHKDKSIKGFIGDVSWDKKFSMICKDII